MSRLGIYDFVNLQVENSSETDFMIPPFLIDEIDVDDNLSRFALDRSVVQRYAFDIAGNGQMRAVSLRLDLWEKSVKAITGHHRIAAIKMINDDHHSFGLDAPVRLRASVFLPGECTDREALLKSFLDNVSVRMSPVDLAKVAQKLLSVGMTRSEVIDQIALSTGKRYSKAKIIQLLKLNELPDEVRILVHTGEVKEYVARRMLKVMDNFTMVEICKDLAAGRIRSSEIVFIIDEFIRERNLEDFKKSGNLKTLQRSVAEIANFISGLGTQSSEVFVKWVRGDPRVTGEMINEIFVDRDDVSWPTDLVSFIPDDVNELIEVTDEWVNSNEV